MNIWILPLPCGPKSRGNGKGSREIFLDISMIEPYIIDMSAARLSVGQEIKQGRPFASTAQEGAIGLLLTADLLRRRIAAVVEPHGITVQQYNVLRILRGAGPVGLPTLEVAERMIEKAPGVTRLLDRLEAAGHVERHRAPSDRRQVLCTITARGLALLGTLDAPIRATDDCFEVLPPADVDRLAELLDALREAWRDLDSRTAIPEGRSARRHPDPARTARRQR